MKILIIVAALALMVGCSHLPEDPDIGDGQPLFHPSPVIKFRPGENRDKK